MKQTLDVESYPAPVLAEFIRSRQVSFFPAELQAAADRVDARAKEEQRNEDLNPARGIVNGVACGVLCWICIGIVLWLLVRSL